VSFRWESPELAAAYDFGRPGYPSEAISVLAAPLAPASACRLLDLGAGNGMLSRELLGFGRVISADPSATLLRRLVSNTPTVPVVRAVAEPLPFPAVSFDAVVVSQSLHWFEDRAFDGVIRVLLRGGTFAATWNLRDARDPPMLVLEGVIGRDGDPEELLEGIAERRPDFPATVNGWAWSKIEHHPGFDEARLAALSDSLRADGERRATKVVRDRLGDPPWRLPCITKIVIATKN
jgi:SAM-dependent methyltransferase